MNTFEKIWKLIQEDKEIADNLFLFRNIATDVLPWLGEKVNEYNSYKWLYESQEQSLSLIGIEDNNIYAIDDEGQFCIVCEGLENVPYEILRVQCQDIHSETIKELLEYKPNFLNILKKYEKWCKDEGIVLDKYNIYHDQNGNLFTKYFETS